MTATEADDELVALHADLIDAGLDLVEVLAGIADEAADELDRDYWAARIDRAASSLRAPWAHGALRAARDAARLELADLTGRRGAGSACTRSRSA